MQRSDALIGAAVAGFFIVMGVLYAQLAMSPDQAIFAYVGWQFAEGATLFVDVGEQNWPGAMWLHGLAVEVFGRVPWAWRAFELILLAVTTYALSQLLPRSKDKLQPVLLWIIYPTMYMTGGLWFSGQRDVVAGHLLVIGGAAFAARLRGGHLAWTVVVAVALFVATMVRPTFLLFAPLLLLVAIFTRKQTGMTWKAFGASVAVTLGGFLGLLGATLLVGNASGGLQGFWEQSVDYNLGVYQEATFQWDFLLRHMRRVGGILPIALLAALAWFQARTEPVGGGVLLALTGTSVVSYAIMGKGFGYHLGGFHPVLGALATVGVLNALPVIRRPGPLRRRVVAFGLVALVALGLARAFLYDLDSALLHTVGVISKQEMLEKQEFGDQWLASDYYGLAEQIQRETPEDATVLTWSRLPIVNYLSGRKLPFAWSNQVVLELARPPFKHAEKWQAQTLAQLERAPPAMIVTDHDEDGELLFMLPPEQATPFVKWVRRTLAEDYREVGRYGQMRLWARR